MYLADKNRIVIKYKYKNGGQMKSLKFLKFTKMILLITLISVTLLSSSVFAVSAVRVTINGTTVPFTTTQPFVDENGRTQVPFKIVLETFGAEVKWDNATREAIATKDGIGLG